MWGTALRKIDKSKAYLKDNLHFQATCLKKFQMLRDLLFKYSLLSSLPTLAAHFSCGPHLSHWVTSLPSSKKLLLQTAVLRSC